VAGFVATGEEKEDGAMSALSSLCATATHLGMITFPYSMMYFRGKKRTRLGRNGPQGLSQADAEDDEVWKASAGGGLVVETVKTHSVSSAHPDPERLGSDSPAAWCSPRPLDVRGRGGRPAGGTPSFLKRPRSRRARTLNSTTQTTPIIDAIATRAISAPIMEGRGTGRRGCALSSARASRRK
jgi:hypothetical protein